MTNKQKMALIGGLTAVGLATAGGVMAFQEAGHWHDDPSQGQRCGGGDLWYTGGFSDWNLACTHCHINDKNQQGNLTANVTGFDPGNKYAPGKTYTITLTMVSAAAGGELAKGNAQNKNGFAATVEDEGGKTAGTFLGSNQTSCPPPPTLPDGAFAPATTLAYGDCHAISSLGLVGLSSWTFKWTAPGNATGPLTFYYGLVDGDANQRSLSDDVKMGTILLSP